MLDIPRTPTDEVIMKAALDTAKELAQWSEIKDNEIEAKAKDIAAVTTGMHQNAYEICKNLDARHYWEINAQIVEVMDGYTHRLEKYRDEYIKQWILEMGVKPPFEVGTRVTWNGGKTGVISGIYTHRPATYAIKDDDGPEDEFDDDGGVKRYSRALVWWDKVAAK